MAIKFCLYNFQLNIFENGVTFGIFNYCVSIMLTEYFFSYHMQKACFLHQEKVLQVRLG